jgi:predicted ABC-type ATPase
MPDLTVVAGPNGSGRSTLIRYLQVRKIELGTYINADDIAKDNGLSGMMGSKIAQQAADIMRADCLRNQMDFSFETVMSHESKPIFMEAARAAGFHVTLYFVCTDDPQTNVSRVGYRVHHGGHDVPVERIVARYHRTLELLPRAIRACDLAVLFDNSVDRTKDMSATMRPVMRFSRAEAGLLVCDFQERPPQWALGALERLGMQ